LDLDLESLGKTNVVVPAFDLEVTSVTKTQSTVGKSPAAIFVVTQEMIRRSGANSIPDVLRLVPGLQVARIDANKWTVSARGFNGRFANKLLVLVDGRSVYTPLFSGVYWETLDMILQDVERIEVIRGPGATQWGANAVNGVINIISKKSSETQGMLVTAGGGDQDKSINSFRYGGRLSDETTYRIYGKHTERNRGFNAAGSHDDWRFGRLGFQADWEPSCEGDDRLTLQGELYSGTAGESGLFPTTAAPFIEPYVTDLEMSGAHILSRWDRQISDTETTSLQFYYDRNSRNEIYLEFDVDVLDIEYQHQLLVADCHNVTWGAGYRFTSFDSRAPNPLVLRFEPNSSTINRVSAFIQDQFPLFTEELSMIVGSKFSYNTFSGAEFQPSVRTIWSPDEYHAYWLAASRAVRTPSIIDNDVVARVPNQMPPPVHYEYSGSRRFDSEQLTALEAGFRTQVTENVSYDVTTFYNHYDSLRTATLTGLSFGPPSTAFGELTNGADAESYGIEISGNWAATECLSLQGWYSFMRLQRQDYNPELDDEEGFNPFNQASLMTMWDLPNNFEFDVIGRYTDSLPALDMDSYISMDLRLGWRPNQCWELSIIGQNLLQSHRQEFKDTIFSTTPTAVNRGVFAQAIFRH